MEKFGTIPMEQLHENAERIWKVLSQFPNGEATAKRVMQITSMSRTTTYNALGELRSKGFVINEKGAWKIIQKPSQKISTEVKPSRTGFFEWLDRRAEKKKFEEEERRLEACAESDLLAEQSPSLAPLKVHADGVRKEIEESRKQRRKDRE